MGSRPDLGCCIGLLLVLLFSAFSDTALEIKYNNIREYYLFPFFAPFFLLFFVGVLPLKSLYSQVVSFLGFL